MKLFTDNIVSLLKTMNRSLSKVLRHAIRDFHFGTRSVCQSAEGQAHWREVLKPRGWTPEFRPWQNLPNSAGYPSGRPAAVRNGVCWPMTGINLYVNYRGDVIPCCSYPDLPPMGNLLNQKFSVIHIGNCRKNVLNDLKTNRVEHPIFGQCEA